MCYNSNYCNRIVVGQWHTQLAEFGLPFRGAITPVALWAVPVAHLTSTSMRHARRPAARSDFIGIER